MSDLIIKNNKLISCETIRGEIVIPSGITSIEDFAFAGFNCLSRVVIPDSVIHIGNHVFDECDNLIYNIKNGLKYLGNANNPYLYLAGAVDTNIVTAIIDKKCKFIGSNAFQECDYLTSVIIPNSIISIGESAFAYCSSLNAITIPNNIRKIDKGVFAHCKSLNNIKIPNRVESIGDYSFYKCTTLSNIEIPSSVTSIGSGVFSDCCALIYNLKDGLKYLGNAGNPYLYLEGVEDKNIITARINNSCRFISLGAFSGCNKLKNVLIPSEVISIGDSAFSCCYELANIVIPSSVVKLGACVFHRCDLVRTIFCEALSKPNDWDENWNYKNKPVVWGIKIKNRGEV